MNGIKRILLLLILICPLGFAAETKTKVLFVLYDTGETRALQPVMKLLEQKNISYKTLVMGTASSLIHDAHVLDITKDCKISQVISQKTWPREQKISDADLQKIKACISPCVVITGMVSEVQRQISELEKNENHPVLAFYDALAPLQSALQQSFLPVVTELLVPMEEIKDKLKNNPAASELKIETVGQPTLEVWAVANKNINPKDVYKKIPHFDPNKKTILYVGGYGATYEQAFTLFAQAVAPMKNYNILVSLHPKVDGSLEKSILEKAQAQQAILLPKTIPTMEAAAITNVLVNQNSTVGIQALFMNKPVIYLDIPGSTYKDIAIEKNWSKKVDNVSAFREEIGAALDKNNAHQIDIYKEAKIPQHSAEHILDSIEQELSTTSCK